MYKIATIESVKRESVFEMILNLIKFVHKRFNEDETDTKNILMRVALRLLLSFPTP